MLITKENLNEQLQEIYVVLMFVVGLPAFGFIYTLMLCPAVLRKTVFISGCLIIFWISLAIVIAFKAIRRKICRVVEKSR